jgi:hypothetical protein
VALAKPKDARTPSGEPVAREESIQELYYRAQAAIHAWADLEVNKPLILSGDCEALRHDLAVQVILRLVEKGGAAVVDRLRKHLEFVVENRKQYYVATGSSQQGAAGCS